MSSKDSGKILYGRYKGLLNGHNVGLVCGYLTQCGKLTSQEAETVLSVNDEAGKKRQLAMVLSTKGVTKLSEMSSLLRGFKSSGNEESTESAKVEGTGKMELLRHSPKDSPMMDPFTVLFSTFIAQLKLFLTENRGPSWLTDDVAWDTFSDYFPPSAVRGITHKSVGMRLSVLLEAYQQLNGSGSADLQKQVRDLEHSYEKSEERCKQLVVVTQQWAIECGDKDKAISIYETEVKQLKESITQLEKRVGKYKRFWQDNRSADQFEEIRDELEHRKNLCCQLFEEKAILEKKLKELSQENKRVLATVETLKDHLAEAEDRLGNMKLQATVKEPTVREMSHLVAELRESQALNQQLLEEKNNMEDQLLALQMTVEEYQGESQVPIAPPPAPQPRVLKTQALVTGFRPRQLNKDAYSPRLDGASYYNSVHDDTESTSSEETLPSSEFQSSRTMDLDPPPKSSDYDSESFSVGLPEGDYTLGTRYPNHSSIKIPPLDVEPSRCEGATNKDKVCPVCHRSFMALSEREFQTHVAGCFK